jgi:hypothetical protein
VVADAAQRLLYNETGWRPLPTFAQDEIVKIFQA